MPARGPSWPPCWTLWRPRRTAARARARPTTPPPAAAPPPHDAALAGDRSAFWAALRAAERSSACARSALDRLARAALDADPRAAEGGGALAARLRGLKADLVRRSAGLQAPALRAHAVCASRQQNAGILKY